jgi:hypothetical protein
MDVTPCGLVGADISEDAASIFRIEVKSLLWRQRKWCTVAVNCFSIFVILLSDDHPQCSSSKAVCMSLNVRNHLHSCALDKSSLQAVCNMLPTTCTYLICLNVFNRLPFLKRIFWGGWNCLVLNFVLETFLTFI